MGQLSFDLLDMAPSCDAEKQERVTYHDQIYLKELKKDRDALLGPRRAKAFAQQNKEKGFDKEPLCQQIQEIEDHIRDLEVRKENEKYCGVFFIVSTVALFWILIELGPRGDHLPQCTEMQSYGVLHGGEFYPMNITNVAQVQEDCIEDYNCLCVVYKIWVLVQAMLFMWSHLTEIFWKLVILMGVLSAFVFI